MRAVRVLKAESKTYISIADWTKYINSNDYHSFDPRRSEWTALEIIRQVIEPQEMLGVSFAHEAKLPDLAQMCSLF